jgi:hypothetical protein
MWGFFRNVSVAFIKLFAAEVFWPQSIPDGFILNRIKFEVNLTQFTEQTPACDFNTHECDLYTHECDVYSYSVMFTRTSVASTRRVWFQHNKVWFLYNARVWFWHAQVRCGLTCLIVISTCKVQFLHEECDCDTHE